MNCLYAISGLLENPEAGLAEIFQGVVDVISPACQYGEIACARISYENQDFKTANFRKTLWRLKEGIWVCGKEVGNLEISYLEKKPERDEGPFVKEERSLVRAIAQRLGKVIERKQTLEALQESEERFKGIFENAPIGFYRTSPDGRILDANPALIQMLGYSCFEELASVNLESEDYQPLYPRRLFRERMERNGEIKGLESFWKKPDGTLLYVRENARAIPDPHGVVLYYEGTVEDVTEQKQAEQQIRTLTQQLIRAQESERQLISRELHDRFAQELSTAKILCDMLLSEKLPEVGEKAAEISRILQGAIEGIRDLSYDLRPASLDQLGLAQTILQYCEGFSDKSRIHVDFFSAGIEHLALDADTGINIYRLVQEGLNNIRKHSAATHATVKLVASSPNIILRIEDNGRGFDVKKRLNTAREEKRMGLQSMQERVGLLQGKMGIHSIPGKGTRILMEIPIKEKKGAGEEDHTNR